MKIIFFSISLFTAVSSAMQRDEKSSQIIDMRNAVKAYNDAYARDYPLHQAVKCNDLPSVERLLQDHDVNERDDDKYTPLMKAAARDNGEVLKLLLEKKADVNLADKRWGQTALHFAAFEGSDDCARMLVNHGANVNLRDRDNDTPVMLAIRFHRDDIAQMLLNAGVHVPEAYLTTLKTRLSFARK